MLPLYGHFQGCLSDINHTHCVFGRPLQTGRVVEQWHIVGNQFKGEGGLTIAFDLMHLQSMRYNWSSKDIMDRKAPITGK